MLISPYLVRIMIQNGKRIDVFYWYKKRSLPGLIHLPDILIPQTTKQFILISTAGPHGYPGDKIGKFQNPNNKKQINLKIQ